MDVVQACDRYRRLLTEIERLSVEVRVLEKKLAGAHEIPPDAFKSEETCQAITAQFTVCT